MEAAPGRGAGGAGRPHDGPAPALATERSALLRAREERAERIERLAGVLTAAVGTGHVLHRAGGRRATAAEAAGERMDAAGTGAGACLVAAGLSIPGAQKRLPGSRDALATAVDLLVERLHAACIPAGIATDGAGVLAVDHPAEDGLGPFLAVRADGGPEAVKRICVGLEETLAWGRVLDLDVYAVEPAEPPAGAAPGSRPALRQVSRAALGLPPRPCLLCGEPARECILLRRHGPDPLRQRTEQLLALAGRSALLLRLALELTRGARVELDLTPKPGLVDRRDSGSHPDLDHAAMLRSISLLPRYYAELIELTGAISAEATQPPRIPAGVLSLCVAAGRRAEERMFAAVGSNAHRGYIFLSGLVLLAAWEAASVAPERLRPAVAELARRFFGREEAAGGGAGDDAGGDVSFSGTRPGAEVRRAYELGGIEAEALAGVPAVFEGALPLLASAMRGGADPPAADLYGAMAAVMTRLEDTTAVRRCGLAGLDRIRRDGARLRAMLSRGENPRPQLELWNEEYRAWGLTMGGVADGLALAIALAGAGRGVGPVDP